MEKEIVDHPYRLRIRTMQAGEDFIFVLTGGKEHIGATATSYLREGKPVTEVYEIPHHKEGQLVSLFAEAAAVRLGAVVTVVAGIHIDHATKQDIDRIVADANQLFEEELTQLEEKQKKALRES